MSRAFPTGIEKTYASDNLRFSQLAPLGMFEEKKYSLQPACPELTSCTRMEMNIIFYSWPRVVGRQTRPFYIRVHHLCSRKNYCSNILDERIAALGTAACPPYHLAVVIGGTSAEANLKTVKLASARFLDGLPIAGDPRWACHPLSGNGE